MTTEQIAVMANRGYIATADFNLADTLRFEVIPEFFGALPEAVWRRRSHLLIILANNRGPYDLPDDFYSMISVHPNAQPYYTYPYPGDGLKFIGEDPHAMAAAQMATVPAQVGGYYIEQRETDGEMKALMLSGLPDQDFNAICTYVGFPYFTNRAHVVDMNPYIPEPLQHGLVHLLRAKIYLDRYGEGDQRAQAAMAQYSQVIDLAIAKYALARRNYAIYVS